MNDFKNDLSTHFYMEHNADEIKFAWKIQRDMAERGWTLAQVQESIEARKPDFAAYVAPQMEFSDVVISVLPSDISTEAVGKHLKVTCSWLYLSILVKLSQEALLSLPPLLTRPS